MTDRVRWIALIAAFWWAWPGSTVAEPFRVENKVYVGDEEEPVTESTTIFFNNAVYDFLAKPAEVTIFDKGHGRFILLDISRRVKTEVTTDQVREFNERLKQWAITQPDAFLKFLIEPQFEEQHDEGAGEMVFSSPWLTYRVVTMELENEEFSQRYHEFSDWSSQLNTLLNPGARPPFARMLVNAALEARQRFPREVHLTLRSSDSLLARRVTLRSEHQLVRPLVQSDRDRIAQTDQFIAMFKSVSFEEYQKNMGKK